MKLPIDTPCPNCGAKKWKFPPAKGQYGWYDTNLAMCKSCKKVYRISIMKEVKGA